MQEENNNRGNTLNDFLSLVKVRLSVAVSFSGATGYLIYNNRPDYDFLLLISGIFLLTCGSAALNQYTERIPDAAMKRTMHRPVVLKRISAGLAASVSSLLIISGLLLLLLTGIKPFILGISGVFLYNLIYTSLKKVTAFAIIPGAMVGFVPPLIGFASAGGTVMNEKILFFAVFMFLWQIPHFWLLLLRYGKEYRDAGFKTISNYLNSRQIRLVTALWLVISSLFLILFSVSERIFDSLFTCILIILTSGFISALVLTLFMPVVTKDLKYSFVILNLFSFLIMLFLIAESLMG